jgi:hypothetical protein
MSRILIRVFLNLFIKKPFLYEFLKLVKDLGFILVQNDH